MSADWAARESKKADAEKDIIILEHPGVKRYLDGLLLDDFWPDILECLVSTGYVYSPEENPETDLEPGPAFARCLSFMLFENRCLFFRGKIIASKEFWMLESEFFLGLSRETPPEVVFEILGNSRLIGMPPELTIDKSRREYYQIEFHNGSGASWGLHGRKFAKERIRTVVDINVKMHEFTDDGVILPQDLGEFLSLVYGVYEAY